MTPLPDPRSVPHPVPEPAYSPESSAPTAMRAPASTPESERDENSVSGQHLESTGAKLARVSEPRERQAVDVRPMYYVLGAGMAGTVLGMIVSYVLL
jgi:hypothetical protein